MQSESNFTRRFLSRNIFEFMSRKTTSKIILREKNISEDNCVINSWVGYPWLSVNFGLDSSKGADYIRLPAFFRFRRHVHIYPKTDNAFFLRMQLPKETMDRFKQSLNSCGVGFKEVPLNNTSGQLSSKMEVGKPNPLPGGMQRAFLWKIKEYGSFVRTYWR